MFAGGRMPVCSRCFGMNLGHSMALLLTLVSCVPSLQVCVGMTIPTLCDWSLQEFLGITSTNLRRFATGSLGGLGIGFLFWSVAFAIAEVVV